MPAPCVIDPPIEPVLTKLAPALSIRSLQVCARLQMLRNLRGAPLRRAFAPLPPAKELVEYGCLDALGRLGLVCLPNTCGTSGNVTTAAVEGGKCQVIDNIRRVRHLRGVLQFVSEPGDEPLDTAVAYYGNPHVSTPTSLDDSMKARDTAVTSEVNVHNQIRMFEDICQLLK